MHGATATARAVTARIIASAASTDTPGDNSAASCAVTNTGSATSALVRLPRSLTGRCPLRLLVLDQVIPDQAISPVGDFIAGDEGGDLKRGWVHERRVRVQLRHVDQSTLTAIDLFASRATGSTIASDWTSTS